MLIRHQSSGALFPPQQRFSRILARLTRRWPYRRTAPRRTWPTSSWESLLQKSAQLIRAGAPNEAMELLRDYLDAPIGDAAFLNLIGAICESRRQWKRARKFYSRAMRANRAFEPAQLNLQRLYELHAFGRCERPVALGDEVPGQWLARFHDRHE